MNKIKKYIVIITIVSLIFGIVPYIHDDASNLYASDKSKDDDDEDDEKEAKLSKKQEAKKTYAQNLGIQYGGIYAVRDFARKLKANSSRHFSTRKLFDNYFNRSTKSDTVFYSQFKSAFREAYDIKFMELNSQTYQNGELQWFEIAQKYGKVEGQIAAFHDFSLGKKKDSELAYNEILRDKSVFERFHLASFGNKVVRDFKDQFRVFFQSEYENSYMIALDKEASENTNYYYINSEAKTISLEVPRYEVSKMSVSKINLPSQNVEVKFKEGSVFDNAPVGTPIALKYNEYRYNYQKLPKYLLPQTGIFQLDLKRGVNSVEFYQEPLIIFSGYTNLPETNSIGIYKWKDNRWEYVPTKRDKKEKTISSSISKGLYRDTEYAVFYDKTYKMPNDIILNWAMEALDVEIRRHNVKYEVKLRPNDKISRLELADIIYRSFAHKNPVPQSVLAPSDVPNDYKRAVSFCITRGYLTKFNDGNFKPNMLVKYEHFKILMNRIYGNNFDAEGFLQNMRKKGHEPDYVKGINPFITRAEVLFTLYTYSK